MTDEIIRNYYENKQQSYEIVYVAGKRHGKIRSWYNTGQQSGETNWFENKIHGKSIFWFRNGQKQSEYHYENDILHGKFEIWNYEGKLISSGDYVMNYDKKYLFVILRTLRKAKWIRLAKMTKTKSFNEWWYSPDNPGGKIAKKKLSMV
jgi:hypothetical protein